MTTLGDIWQSGEALQLLLDSQDLSAGVAWRLTNFMPILEKIGKQQGVLVEKHGGRVDQQTKVIDIPNQKFEAYSKDFESLMIENEALDISVTLEEIEDAGLSPRQLYSLRYLISDEPQNGQL